MKIEVNRSGLFYVAEIDCHDCAGPSSLSSPKCRRCVFEALGGEDPVRWVTLKRSYRHVYTSPDLSRLARTLALLAPMVRDRAHYAPGEEKRKCRRCVNRRRKKMLNLWPKLVENPHDLSVLNELAKKEGKQKGECAKCTEGHFLALVKSIRSTLRSIPPYRKLTEKNYDEVFEARVMPFFVEGVWSPPKGKTELIDSYNLEDGRGRARILRREGRPIPFYQLELPEFRLSSEEVGLLYDAFRVEISGAPGHARFARPSRVHGFTQDWYNTLLHMVRERGGTRVSAGRLRELATWMASWLTYRSLEPFSHDEHVTDVYVTVPPELKSVTLVHDKWGTCETGINLTTPSLLGLGEILASKQNRSFDQTNPQLDAEIPELGMRLFMSRDPAIWPPSIAVAIRKRRAKPWTQPLFLERGTLTPLASAVKSTYIRLGASVFVIGDIGTAKTSEVETLAPEIGPGQRVICFQDTEELHVEDFIQNGYTVENVRVTDPEHLENQINAFLRGGAAYWLITEVRETEAVKAALGAAARRGSQPVVSSFHVRTKREMYDLICNIMGLHEAAYKYVDLIVSTAKFDTPEGTIRRIVEISEVLKDWDGKPEYAELFRDNREKDLLEPANLLKGPSGLINRLNSYDLSQVDVVKAAKKLRFLPPSKGGSAFIRRVCQRLAIDEKELLTSILAEARMKSDLLQLSRAKGDLKYLELPFVSKAYDFYFAAAKRHGSDYRALLKEWRQWLGEAA